MANFEKQQCKECIGNTICDDITLVGGMACKKFALKLAEALKPSHNTQMAAALWRELKRRQSNGLVPLRVDWVAVTEKRLNAAVAALRHS